MPSLVHQRCLNHGEREAVARCPSCGQFYCRECITEHDDKVICASCLIKIKRAAPRRKRSLASLGRVAALGAGFLMAWFFFYLLGTALLTIPTSFHDSTAWHSSQAKDEENP